MNDGSFFFSFHLLRCSTGCFRHLFIIDLFFPLTPFFSSKTNRQLSNQVSKPAAQAAVEAKGSYGVGVGEEWIGWMPVMWALRLVRSF